MSDLADSEPRAAAAAAAVPAYDGRLVRFAWLTASTGLLSLATLGIYRFWGRTRVRRYVWSRLSLDGDRLDYTGTGREMFMGFLRVALMIAGLALAGKLLELWSGAHLVQTGQSLVIAAFYLAVPYFARRYRLSRTRWRAIAFGLDPCLGAYIWCRVRWGLLTVVTLGLAAPIDRIKTEACLIRHSRFGNRSFDCTPQIAPALAWWVGAWLAALLTVVAGTATTNTVLGPHGWSVAATQVALARFPAWNEVSGPAVAGFGLTVLFALLAAMFYVYYRLCVQRLVVDGTRIDRVEFGFDPDEGATIRLAIGGALAIAAAAAGIFGCLGVLLVTRPPSSTQGSLAWSGAAMLLVLAVARWIAGLCSVHLYLARQVKHLTIEGTDELAAIGRSPLAAPQRGDGLDSYFDFAT